MDLARLGGRAVPLDFEPNWTTIRELQVSTDDIGYRNDAIFAYLQLQQTVNISIMFCGSNVLQRQSFSFLPFPQ